MLHAVCRKVEGWLHVLHAAFWTVGCTGPAPRHDGTWYETRVRDTIFIARGVWLFGGSGMACRKEAPVRRNAGIKRCRTPHGVWRMEGPRVDSGQSRLAREAQLLMG